LLAMLHHTCNVDSSSQPRKVMSRMRLLFWAMIDLVPAC
jgi:hypothetical protein